MTIVVVFMSICVQAKTCYYCLLSATVRDGQSNLKATMLSKDHKPEDPEESERVESLGMNYVVLHIISTLMYYCLY